jgi:hypothetical protein
MHRRGFDVSAQKRVGSWGCEEPKTGAAWPAWGKSAGIMDVGEGEGGRPLVMSLQISLSMSGLPKRYRSMTQVKVPVFVQLGVCLWVGSPQDRLDSGSLAAASASRAVSLPHGTAIWHCLGPSKFRLGDWGQKRAGVFFLAMQPCVLCIMAVERANNWRSREAGEGGGKGGGAGSSSQHNSTVRLRSRHPSPHPNSQLRSHRDASKTPRLPVSCAAETPCWRIHHHMEEGHMAPSPRARSVPSHLLLPSTHQQHREPAHQMDTDANAE